MQVFDASSMIYAWDNYPIDQFPPLWAWFAAQVQAGQILFPSVAFSEVAAKTPDCAVWLEDQGVGKLSVTNAIAQAALAIKGQLGIVNDQYGAGVGENDIFIVATAQVHGHTLVSDEAVQRIPPLSLKKYKIPAVCGMHGVGVTCISFLTFVKQSGAVFG
jgi:predicted nucleic acid-binding protein